MGIKEPKTVLTAAHELSELTKEREALEDKVSGLTAKIEYLRYSSIPLLMENDGIENIRLEGIGTVYLTSGIRASINQQVKPLAYQWLEDNGHGGLITQTVNAQSLTSALSARMKSGAEIPDELFKIFAYTMAAIKSK